MKKKVVVTGMGVISPVGNAVQEFMSKHNIKKFKRSIMVISRNDDHPSSVSNRIFADVIYDYFKKSGVIIKVMNKSGLSDND